MSITLEQSDQFFNSSEATHIWDDYQYQYTLEKARVEAQRFLNRTGIGIGDGPTADELAHNFLRRV